MQNVDGLAASSYSHISQIRDDFKKWEFSRINPAKQTLICVSPYSFYPPSHGGGKRMVKLYEHLAQWYNLVVLSDEGNSYPDIFTSTPVGPCILYAISGRVEEDAQMGKRIGRIQSHSRPALSALLNCLIDRYHASAVVVEYVELAGLILQKHKSQNIPWIIDLHDVLFEFADENSIAANDFERNLLQQYDVRIVCSEEDQRLVSDLSSTLVRNGVDSKEFSLEASDSKSKNILFAGPFRYPPNRLGIEYFLTHVFPRIRLQVETATITILAGDGNFDEFMNQDCFRQEGVTVINRFVPTKYYLRECALTINVLQGNKGSSLKVIESLAARRMCISTREGARGHADKNFSGLKIYENIDALADPIIQYLNDYSSRQLLEQNCQESLVPFEWSYLAGCLHDAVQDVIQ